MSRPGVTGTGASAASAASHVCWRPTSPPRVLHRAGGDISIREEPSKHHLYYRQLLMLLELSVKRTWFKMELDDSVQQDRACLAFHEYRPCRCCRRSRWNCIEWSGENLGESLRCRFPRGGHIQLDLVEKMLIPS